MNSSKTKEIIEYLYKLEFMTPFYPTTNIIYDSKSNKPFTTNILANKKKDFKKEIVYTCFLGQFNYDLATEKLIKNLNLDIETKNNKYNTKSIIIGFKLREDGSYLEGTLGISNCVYGINKIIKNKNLDISLTHEEATNSITSITNEVSKINITSNLFLEDLEKIYNKIEECFPLIKDEFQFEFLLTKEETYLKEDKTSSPAILSSFYTKDLSELKENPTPKIIDFLSLNTNKKIEIDKNTEEMKKILSPEKYPLGKWPSEYTPILMQQIGINLSLDFEKPVFSINGPPGSGKTTLVKEIIADKIVRRAEILANYKNPDDAFKEKEIKSSQNQYHTRYYEIDKKLTKYSILVASNNNKAVENISLELPLKIKKSLTSLFCTKENKDIYFTDTASKLLKKESWGLISVPLGKKDNINNFTQTTYYKDEPESIKYKIQNMESNFPEAKKLFLKKLNEVKNYRDYLIKTKKDTEEYENILPLIKTEKAKFKEENNILKKLLEEEKELNNKKQTLENNINNTKNDLHELSKIIPLIIKILAFILRKHKLIVKKKHLMSKIRDYTLERLEIKEKINDLQPIILQKKEKVKKIENSLNSLKEKKETLSDLINKYTKIDNIKIANNEFFDDITNNEKSQDSVLWTNTHYDTLREELFFYALNLHKNFILSSLAFKHNLSLIVDAISNSFTEEERIECYTDLLQTLFLLVPVISTSLASVQKFLSTIKKDTIALLIIDEAGQATPASVLGVINRSIKTIILGDPFQLEPVIPTPETIYKIFSYKKDIPNIFSDITLSAQVLADLQNPYGAKRGVETWIGCPLLMHRRCLNPMFKIANEIAYENRMFYGTKDPDNDIKLSLEKSTWYDIKGFAENESHYIKEQGQKAIELLEKALEINDYKLPNLFIITPFKDIEIELQKELNIFLKRNTKYNDKEIKDWISEKCGTIHTFQGKEADEVILILGCKDKAHGVYWASKKPNTLNVAITRAKYRISIIGDSLLWKDTKYFNVAYKHLNEKNTSN